MKMRIKGDSLRLRISPSEMAGLLHSGRIEETIHFGPEQDAKLTYALQTGSDPSAGEDAITVRYRPREIAVVVPAMQIRAWADGAETGIYAAVDNGVAQLDLAIEKDFACLDRHDGDNDTFPNPKQGTVC